MLPANFIEARNLLLRNYPFYGIPALGSEIILTEEIPTAATDGRAMLFNPKFIDKMPVPHLAFVIAHESIHILCGHPSLMAKKQWPDNAPLLPAKFNKAADYWINANLKAEQFQFCTKVQPLYSTDYMNQAIRTIYDKLPDPPPTPSNGGASGGNGDLTTQAQGGLTEGDDCIPYNLTPEEVTEQRIKTRTAVEAAKSQGKLPKWAEQYVEEMNDPKLDYRELLPVWITSCVNKNDVNWKQLNRRYLPDFYCPILSDTSFGRLAVGLDTSGSVWEKAPQFLSELNGILKQLRPLNTLLLPFDTEIKETTEFGPGEEVQIGMKLYGGGGTDFRPVFDHLLGEPIDGLIMLTDMYGTFPDAPPSYPVLWVSITDIDKAPFGTVVHADI
jgi:predicted metal-dependent peptidase